MNKVWGACACSLFALIISFTFLPLFWYQIIIVTIQPFEFNDGGLTMSLQKTNKSPLFLLIFNEVTNKTKQTIDIYKPLNVTLCSRALRRNAAIEVVRWSGLKLYPVYEFELKLFVVEHACDNDGNA